jgi:hypothetical protein
MWATAALLIESTPLKAGRLAPNISPQGITSLSPMEYMTSDHSVAGSSPAGCKLLISRDLLIDFDLNWMNFRNASSFHPHFLSSKLHGFEQKWAQTQALNLFEKGSPLSSGVPFLRPLPVTLRHSGEQTTRVTFDALRL